MRSLFKVFTSCNCIHFKLTRNFSLGCRLLQNQPLAIPKSEDEPESVSPKIENLVNEISKLTLIEVSELSSALKKKLNIPDMPAMSFAGFAAPGSTPAADEADDDAPVAAVKSSFNVKLVKFDDSKKIALIKEIKALLSGINLVEAKKFVESAPVIVKADLGKDEADALKESLEKVGAEIVVE